LKARKSRQIKGDFALAWAKEYNELQINISPASIGIPVNEPTYRQANNGFFYLAP
jgi:hypothetical protein